MYITHVLTDALARLGPYHILKKRFVASKKHFNASLGSVLKGFWKFSDISVDAFYPYRTISPIVPYTVRRNIVREVSWEKHESFIATSVYGVELVTFKKERCIFSVSRIGVRIWPEKCSVVNVANSRHRYLKVLSSL